MPQKQGTSPKTKRANGPRKMSAPRISGKKRKSGLSTTGTDILSEVELDRRHQDDQEQEPRPTTDRALDFRRTQAIAAMTYEPLLRIKADSAAGRLILKTLENFPTIRVPKDSKVNRTQLAINAAIRQLSGDDLHDRQSLEHGKKVVKRALFWAYDQVNTPPSERHAVA